MLNINDEQYDFGEAAKKHTQIKKIAKDADYKLLMLGI